MKPTYLILSILFLCSNCHTERAAVSTQPSAPQFSFNCDNRAEYHTVSGVPLKGQLAGLMCWAGTTEMLHDYFGQSRTQCDIAGSYLNTTCCGNIGICNNPQDMGNVLNHFSISKQSKNFLTWDEIVNELNCNNKPMVYNYWIGERLYHITTIVGYSVTENEKYLIYHDPLPLGRGYKKTITYNQYLNGHGLSDPQIGKPFSTMYNLIKN